MRNSPNKAEPGLTLHLLVHASTASPLGCRLLPFPLLSPVAVEGKFGAWLAKSRPPFALPSGEPALEPGRS